ncbi:hypothetical protein ABT336_14420 [Micromonospora sp. NPDC000207]|uniref:hypothetical protein n=1 Tax=Micromonospora sp. NPDC000207 TaxID=3154246 RepID=UPI00332194F1
MPDALLATRPALPYTTRHGLTVQRIGAAIYIGGQWYSPTEARDLGAVIGRAVAQVGAIRTPNHTPEGA